MRNLRSMSAGPGRDKFTEEKVLVDRFEVLTAITVTPCGPTQVH
jgi:hypothetical protein